MDKLVKALKWQRRPSHTYEPLEDSSTDGQDDARRSPSKTQFSWLEYYIFLLLGISMLWAWNMFLAAAPYFQSRFSSDEWILTHFQSAILTVSTVTNLGSMLLLTHLQQKASYPKRIVASLVLNIICFTLLALSTTLFKGISAMGYFVFLMFIVFTASLATGLCQNGLFAFVAGFGMSEYTQAIMTGQAVAGILPCIAQIVSVLSVPDRNAEGGAGQESPTSAFAYFMTATGVSALALTAFVFLARRHRENSTSKQTVQGIEGAEEEEHVERKVVGMVTLFKKLRWLAMGVFVCFAATMVFPVFTSEITSNQSHSKSSRVFKPACFIPLAFLVWNFGDLAGRLLTLSTKLNMVLYPRFIFILSLLRVGFVPLYLLCNIRDRGAIVQSDVFYLLVIQLLFGMTNGYVGSTCMMGASEWVKPDEREAAGGFMGLMLVWGLTIGSLLSFLAAKA
ncbi:hypothetical protein MMC26_002849 [Xylographa opegraphella]|nr:hypothetical protein [Xylographa opegraphella]